MPYRATFISDNELWVVTSFMAYGSAKDLLSTHFTDGMSELAIAYILQGVLKALDYIHHMGYVHRSVKASHILISVDGKVYLSGLRSNLSMISHGQWQRVVHDFPKYSVKVLPWLSPEVLQQVCAPVLKCLPRSLQRSPAGVGGGTLLPGGWAPWWSPRAPCGWPTCPLDRGRVWEQWVFCRSLR